MPWSNLHGIPWSLRGQFCMFSRQWNSVWYKTRWLFCMKQQPRVKAAMSTVAVEWKQTLSQSALVCTSVCVCWDRPGEEAEGGGRLSHAVDCYWRSVQHGRQRRSTQVSCSSPTELHRLTFNLPPPPPHTHALLSISVLIVNSVHLLVLVIQWISVQSGESVIADWLRLQNRPPPVSPLQWKCGLERVLVFLRTFCTIFKAN